eukprot:TRINITY_DN10527_c0_g2_i1.p1 TRINITY_DN10527_c0_g2~~TRINITY_DN10527_c0_g2_i1.p1  ORF type:complete len:173 (+),score=43.21 TRINITY_DN10527_c0_g2_i1:62-580(+)
MCIRDRRRVHGDIQRLANLHYSFTPLQMHSRSGSPQYGNDEGNNLGGDTKNNDAQGATNVKHHIGIVENVIETANEGLLEYKREVDSLKQELNLMKQKILNANEEIFNILNPAMDAMYRDLKSKISDQKLENEKIQIQLTELKKEKSQIQQLIIGCTQKLQQLEETVGSYTS